MDDPLPQNPYETLSVPKDATLATIRSSYRKLVLSCHPDKVQEEGAKKAKAEQFHQVQQAYEVLGDEKKRQRYDEKVKLDELRAEMANERGPPLSRRRTDFEYGPSRGGAPPKREMRDNVFYETREPKSNRYSDEDYFTPRYETRSSPRTYDDYFPPTSARRPSGRPSEDKRRAREAEDERDRRRREREDEARAREQQSKRRDKEKKRNSETKSKGRFSAQYDSGSDSELDDRHYSSRRDPLPKSRYDEMPTRNRDDGRRADKAERGYEDDTLDSKLFGAQNYMSKTREQPIDVDPRHIGRTRAASTLDARTPLPQAETSKRSTARRGYSSRQASPVRPSKKDRRSPEIVDAPSSRKPSLPGSTSDSRGMKKGFMGMGMKREPTRSATYQPTSEPKQPSIKRSGTEPMDRSHRNEHSRPSTLKNMTTPSDSESSDSDSDFVEEPSRSARPSQRPGLHHKTMSYRVRGDKEGLVAEPENISPPRGHEDSSNPRRSNRPGMARGSTVQPPSMPRAATHSFGLEERSPRPGLPRTESARPTASKSHQSRTGRLPYEIPIVEEEAYPTRRSFDAYPEDKSRYKSFSRRGSEDVDADAYPGSHRHRRPQMERHGTYAC